MFDSLIEKLLTSVLSGGPQAIIAILLLFCALLILERRRLLQEVRKKDEKIEKIVDEYYKGNLTLTEALNSLRILLYEVKAKI